MKTIPAILILTLLAQVVRSQDINDRHYIKEHTNVNALLNFAQARDSINNSFQLQKGNEVSLTTINSKGEKGWFSGFGPDGKPDYDFDENYDAAATIRTRELWTGGSTGYDLDGSGVVIGHWEASGIPLKTHQELVGKIIVKDTVDSSSHGTHTACTMIGTGINLLAGGMAPGASIEARKSDNDEAELALFGAAGGILSNHSYYTNSPDGVIGLYGSYNYNSKDWDEITYNAPYLLICKSAGNTRNDGVNTDDQGYDIIFTLALAKNILVVGAVDDLLNYGGPSSIVQSVFTSWGPTDDWRIKPDVTANGVGVFSADNVSNTSYDSKSGTSMSVATVTGTIALLQQHYHNINGTYMRSATAKALLICTTEEAGDYDGPDFQSGWGLVNAENAAVLISNNGNTSFIGEYSIGNGETFTTTIHSDGINPVKLVIAWTDPAGTPIGGTDNKTPMLVNDLDIRLAGNGNTYMPWMMEPNATSDNFTDPALKGDNYRDNVERIDAGVIPAGEYTVTVNHKGTLTNDYQAFSLVMDGLAPGLAVSKRTGTDGIRVKAWPQPATGEMLTIEIDDSRETGKVVSNILDLTGRLIKRSVERGPVFTLDISGIAPGLYILRTQTGKGVISKPIIIEN